MRLPLHNNQWAIIDNEDADDVFAYNWYVSLQGHGLRKLYVVGYHKSNKDSHCTIRLHRMIMNVGKEDKRNVHHIDGDTLNNTKRNLMIMSRGEHSKLKRKTWLGKNL